MRQFPIGVMMEAFRTDTRQAIEQAARLGVKGMQMDAAKGEHAPEHMTKEARRELLDRMHSNGLVFSALCGDLGKGFGNPELNPALIEQSKRILDLAKELGTDIVTTHIGVVPADKTHPRYQIMQDACGELSRYADSLGAHFAIETGPEVSIVLKDFNQRPFSDIFICRPACSSTNDILLSTSIQTIPLQRITLVGKFSESQLRSLVSLNGLRLR